jgi:hypothetical protein
LIGKTKTGFLLEFTPDLLMYNKKMDSCLSLPLIYSGAGMTREQESEN